MNIINNAGASVSQTQRQVGGETIIDVTLEKAFNKDLRRNGPISQGLSSTFGLKRVGGTR